MASTNDASLSKRKAVEPSVYVDMEKICKRCKQSNVKFKFLNNKKQNQPRYQCQDCTLELCKPYHFNPFPIRKHNHEDGYAKLPKVETEELKNFNKVCDYCQAENNATFRGYNNGKVTQPRYACKVCKHLFSPLKNSRATSTKIDVSSFEFQTTGVQYQETRALQQPSTIDVPPYEFQTTGAQYQETGPSQQPNTTNVSPYELQTTGTQYQETGASQQPSNTDVSPYGFQTTRAQYQEMGASQQPSNTDVSPYEFQITGTQYQEIGASQQPSNTDVSPYEFQTAGVQYQETGASQQQPSNIDVSPYEFQTAGTQYQKTGASQPLLPYNTFYNQTSISYHYNPYRQSSDNHPISIVNVAGSSNQCPFPWQNAESSQWQQPSLSYNILLDQNSISSQQHSYDCPYNQSSDNRSLPSTDVDGSSNQYPFPSQNAEASQLCQQPSLPYNTSYDQTSILSQQHSDDYPNNQSSDNHSLASVDANGSSSNQYPFPWQNAEAWHWQWQQPSLYASVNGDGFSNQFPIPWHNAEAWQQASLYNPLGQQMASIPSEQSK